MIGSMMVTWVCGRSGTLYLPKPCLRPWLKGKPPLIKSRPPHSKIKIDIATLIAVAFLSVTPIL